MEDAGDDVSKRNNVVPSGRCVECRDSLSDSKIEGLEDGSLETLIIGSVVQNVATGMQSQAVLTATPGMPSAAERPGMQSQVSGAGSVTEEAAAMKSQTSEKAESYGMQSQAPGAAEERLCMPAKH
jgi:hypothetical protein